MKLDPWAREHGVKNVHVVVLRESGQTVLRHVPRAKVLDACLRLSKNAVHIQIGGESWDHWRWERES